MIVHAPLRSVAVTMTATLLAVLGVLGIPHTAHRAATTHISSTTSTATASLAHATQVVAAPSTDQAQLATLPESAAVSPRLYEIGFSPVWSVQHHASGPLSTTPSRAPPGLDV